MLAGNQLIAALSPIPTVPLSGVAIRVIHIRHLNTALSSIGSILGGRYNPPSAFEALYIADNSVTALLEVEALFKTSTATRSILKPPLVLLSIEYQLNAVLDIANWNVQQALGTNVQEITGNWRLINAQKL